MDERRTGKRTKAPAISLRNLSSDPRVPHLRRSRVPNGAPQSRAKSRAHSRYQLPRPGRTRLELAFGIVSAESQGWKGSAPQSSGAAQRDTERTYRVYRTSSRKHRPRVFEPPPQRGGAKPPAVPARARCCRSCHSVPCSQAHVVILGRLRSHLLQALGAQMAGRRLPLFVLRWI